MGNVRETFEVWPAAAHAQGAHTVPAICPDESSLARSKQMMERLERRLWLTVYGVVGVVLAKAVQLICSVDALKRN
jgi:hypothetical protein